MARSPLLGVITGLRAEARALGRWAEDPRLAVRVTAGRVSAAERSAAELSGMGVRALLSWGLCGGLDPVLRPGDVVRLAAEVAPVTQPVATPAAKAALFASGARIADMESATLAVAGLPVFVLRVVVDEAGFTLPAPALLPLTRDGRPDRAAILKEMVCRPDSLRAMIGLALRYRRAMAALKGQADTIGDIVSNLEAA